CKSKRSAGESAASSRLRGFEVEVIALSLRKGQEHIMVSQTPAPKRRSRRQLYATLKGQRQLLLFGAVKTCFPAARSAGTSRPYGLVLVRKALGLGVAGLLAVQDILAFTLYAFASVDFLPAGLVRNDIAVLVSFVIAGLGISVTILIIGLRRHNERAPNGDSSHYHCDFHCIPPSMRMIATVCR
ncbi:MAG: hypothetical protein ACLP0B_00925, partial [Steroidobacteraceae bacterium]